MCSEMEMAIFFETRTHIYIKRMQTDQYIQLLQKGPQGIRKIQQSPYCYCRSSTSDPAIDLHLFAKPRTQAAVLHHQSETKVQTMESCSTSSVTAHQPSGLSRRSCHTPSLAQRLAHAGPAATRRGRTDWSRRRRRAPIQLHLNPDEELQNRAERAPQIRRRQRST